MADLNALRIANGKRWLEAKLTRDFSHVAQRLIAAKTRYLVVQNKTGVPWWVIAVIHEREASQNFNTQLGQGDPLDRVSVHVPAGRGPFSTWEDGAIDALVNCAPHAARWTDWSAGGAVTLTETYNGLAYASHDRPSPYVWAGTTIYDPPTGPGGKILVDHGPIENVTDKQLGCAGLIKAMIALDPSIAFKSSVVQPTPQPPPIQKPVPQPPSISHPSKGSIGEFIANLIAAFFKRK